MKPPTSMEAALRRRRNIPIATVIDVGASDGRWSELAATNGFGGAGFVLIEANPTHEPKLKGFQKRLSTTKATVYYAIAAASDGAGGQVYFDARDPWGGVASKGPAEGSTLVPSTTVDEQVQQHRVPGPYLLKLDTHGHERFILQGARETLKQTNLLVIEVYNFRLMPGCLRFWEMCDCLRPLGFLPIDLADPMYRPSDGTLWQMDLFFARDDRPEFHSCKYDGT